MKHLLFIPALLFMLTACKQTVTEKKLPEIFQQIKNKNILSYDLKKILKDFDTTLIEDSEFWLSIINDSNYNEMHRGAAALMLFTRHLKVGSSPLSLNSAFRNFYNDRRSVFLIKSNGKRKVKRLSGGSWKDVGYFFSSSSKSETDSLFRNFEQFVSSRNGNLFYIETYGYNRTCNQCYEGDFLGVYIGLTGNMSEKQLENYLHYGKKDGLNGVTVLGVYPEWGTFPSKSNSEDDL